MLLIIDNYDSFTYNLAQYFMMLGQDVRVFRNDELHAHQVEALSPQRLVISPGPGDPTQAGVTMEIISHVAGRIPVLGVCLGMQAIAAALGGQVVHATQVWHGRASQVTHDRCALYDNIPNPFPAGRYHSLMVDEVSLPPELRVTSRSMEDGAVMSIESTDRLLFGVQFHPESILTPDGLRILRNFLQITSPGR